MYLAAWMIDGVLAVMPECEDFHDAYDIYADNPMCFTADQLARAEWRGVFTWAEIETMIEGSNS